MSMVSPLVPPVARAARRRAGFAAGRRRLARMRDAGLPATLHEPIEFLLGGRPSPETLGVVERIEAMRDELAARDDDLVAVYPSPAPEPRHAGLEPAERIAPGARSESTFLYIAEVASISRYWGTFLHLCATASGARTVLELGSCAGISGSYLASASCVRKFVTVEASPELARLAEAHIRRVASAEISVHTAFFDDALDAVLPTFAEGLDLAYVDGQHEGRATLHYLHRLEQRLHPGSIVIFDDVRWTTDMEQAWEELCGTRGVEAAVMLGRLGVLVFGAPGAHAARFDLSRSTAEWRRGRTPSPQSTP
jgi:predicted O-methyltransferase YrrM